MAHHPYSFSNPAEPTHLERRRAVHVTDERARAWDSEAPATAHDWDLERKESRAPLYFAGAASVVILGGLLLLANAATGDPPLGATVETETVPRQAALSEMLDAQALDNARVAARGLLPSSSAPLVGPPVESESPNADVSATPMTSDSPTGAVPMSSDPTSVEPASMEAVPAPEQQLMTPAPASTTSPMSSEPVLDRDNPYTTEIEASDLPVSPAPRATDASDNPY